MLKELKKIMPAVIVTATTGFLMTVAVDSQAAVCSSCHVMHASENSSAIAGGGNDRLLRSDCVGCHTQDNGGGATLANPEPGVYSVTPAQDNDLAGGNFEYSHATDGDQTYGHNPFELDGGDTRYVGIKAPPGWTTGFPTASSGPDNAEVGGGTPNWVANSLTCAGVYGCHGKHTNAELDGAHHANVTDNSGLDGSTVGKSYRFLYGITGWEDADYELAGTSADGDHNVYHAVARAADTAVTKSTISYFCAECHGIFHSGETGQEGVSTDGSGFANPWIRHPVDVVLPQAATEYNSYVFDINVPVGSSDVSDGTIAVASATDRIVMCLSCHRAHASPYPYALRWDYSAIDAGAGASTAGCFACHTTKDT